MRVTIAWSYPLRCRYEGGCRFRFCIGCTPCRVARCNTALIRVSDSTADDWRVSLTSGLGVVSGKWSRTGLNRRPPACHNPARVARDALTTLNRGSADCKRCVHRAALREFASGCAVYTALRTASCRKTTWKTNELPQVRGGRESSPCSGGGRFTGVRIPLGSSFLEKDRLPIALSNAGSPVKPGFESLWGH